MRNRLIFLALVLLTCTGIHSISQTISNYTYRFENGVNVITERGWNWINVSQTHNILDTTKTRSPLLIKIYSIGDLFTEYVTKLYKDSSEVNPETALPGNYMLSVECRLLQRNGILSFNVNGVVIKEKMQTSLEIAVHDAEIISTESPAHDEGLVIYEARIAGNTGQNGILILPQFYAPGTITPEIPPVESITQSLGKNKPGNYDIKFNIELKMTGYSHIIWLQGITLKPDTKYVFSISFNAGELRYSGGNDNVKKIHLYPAGTSNKLKGIAKPQKNIEVLGIERPSWYTICPPGTYDVLLNYGPGIKYEWRKSIVCKVGEQTDID